MAGVEKEAWIADIEENLYAGNEFMNMVGKDDSEYVDNRTVHLPQSGSRPGVKKNRATLPATISQRTDTVKDYSMNWYTLDPWVLTSEEVQFISYNKRQDLINDQVKTIGDAIANQTLYSWAPNAATIRTTGVAAAGALAPGATGNRKPMLNFDIRKANQILDGQNLGVGKRFLFVSSDMYWLDLLGIAEFTKYLEFGKAVIPTGVIGNLFGMDVLMRSSVVVYDNTGTPVIKTVSDDGTPTSTATSDNLGALVIHSPYVRKAKSEVKLYGGDEERAEYYGTVMSAELFHGATQSRTDGKGVVSIVQSA